MLAILRRHSLALAASVPLFLASSASAQSTITALTSANTLVTFSPSAPGTVLSTSPTINGLIAGDALTGIDYRPVDRQLVGLGYNATTGAVHVYSLSLATGAATNLNTNTLTVATGLSRTLLDFNPTANAIRVTTTGATANNYRIPTAGTGVLTADTDLNPSNPGILGSAYSRNQPGGGTSGATTLYLVSGSTLYTQGSADFFTGNGGTSPNSGTLFTVGALSGVNGTITGFDIGYDPTSAGNAYLANSAGTIYGLNLANGAATTLGATGLNITDIAALPVPEPGSMALCVFAAVMVAAFVIRRRQTVA